MEPKQYHEKIMELALEEARKAFSEGEVPIGAVLEVNGDIISKTHNLKEQLRDATAHAEMLAIKEAVEKLGHWRHLKDAVLYVTLEPCPMCAGAIVQTRIKTLVYGANDPKAGAVASLMNIVQDIRLNHRVEVISGVLQEESSEILKRFFSLKRRKANKKVNKNNNY